MRACIPLSGVCPPMADPEYLLPQRQKTYESHRNEHAWSQEEKQQDFNYVHFSNFISDFCCLIIWASFYPHREDSLVVHWSRPSRVLTIRLHTWDSDCRLPWWVDSKWSGCWLRICVSDVGKLYFWWQTRYGKTSSTLPPIPFGLKSVRLEYDLRSVRP